MEHRCPHCASSLRFWSVMNAGPLQPSQCPACGESYYAGGIPLGLFIFNMGLLGASQADRLQLNHLLWVPALLGLLLGFGWMFFSQPKSVTQRRRDLWLLPLTLIPALVPLLRWL